jgi:hypothetical protein
MKKTSKLHRAFLIFLIVFGTFSGLSAQQDNWVRYFPSTAQNLGSFSTNFATTSQSEIIMPAVIEQELQLRKCDMQGSNLDSLNTGLIVQAHTKILTTGANSYALAYQLHNSAEIGLLRFDSELQIISDTTYAELGFKLSRSALHQAGTVIIGGRVSVSNHKAVGISLSGELVMETEIPGTLLVGTNLMAFGEEAFLMSFENANGGTFANIDANNGEVNYHQDAVPYINSRDYSLTYSSIETYSVGYQTNWLPVRRDSIVARKYNSDGVLLNNHIFSDSIFNKCIIDLSNLIYNPTNQHLYFSISSGCPMHNQVGTRLFELDDDLNLIDQRFFPHNYSSDLKRQYRTSFLAVSPNGSLLFSYKYDKDSLELGNILFYALSPDMETIDSLDFNNPFTDSDDLMSGLEFTAPNSFVIAGYTHHELEGILDETIEYFLASISMNFDFISSTNNVLSPSGQVEVFPNPASTELQVTATKPIATCYIFGINGSLINTYPRAHFSVSHLSRGVYILKVVTKSGKVYHKKFLKY